MPSCAWVCAWATSAIRHERVSAAAPLIRICARRNFYPPAGEEERTGHRRRPLPGAAYRVDCWATQAAARCAERWTRRRAGVLIDAETRDRRRGVELARFQLEHD